MVDYQKLKMRMKEVGLGQNDLAKALNLANPTVSQKLSGIRPLKLEELDIIARLLKIDDKQIPEYFFAD